MVIRLLQKLHTKQGNGTIGASPGWRLETVYVVKHHPQHMKFQILFFFYNMVAYCISLFIFIRVLVNSLNMP